MSCGDPQSLCLGRLDYANTMRMLGVRGEPSSREHRCLQRVLLTIKHDCMISQSSPDCRRVVVLVRPLLDEGTVDKKYYWKDLALLQGSVGRMSLDVADEGLIRIRKIMWEFLKTGYRSRPKSDIYIYIHMYISIYTFFCFFPGSGLWREHVEKLLCVPIFLS